MTNIAQEAKVEAEEVPAPVVETKAQEPVVMSMDGVAAPRFTKAWRAITMCYPRCEICQSRPRESGWQRTCTHNPYFHDEQEEVVVPTVICAVCGENVEMEPGKAPVHCDQQDFLAGEPVVKMKFARKPNNREVVVDTAVNGGAGIEWARRQGCVLPQELGFAPMCEFIDCRLPNPSIHAKDGGWYCSEDHAKRVALFRNPESVEVLDEDKMRAQLQNTAY